MVMQTGMEVRGAFANQVAYCRANDAPVTGRVVEAIIAVLDRSTRFGMRVLDWPGQPLADALPLRCAGGFHALSLSGVQPALMPLYAGHAAAMDAAEVLLADALAAHEDALLPWLDGPPQTNEAGRSSGYAAALLWLAARGLPATFDCLEIGSSAGINLMMDRYAYRLGGVCVGSDDAPIVFTPEWRGPPPPAQRIAFVGLKGCDIAPVDLRDPVQALRLTAYIWPEHHQRFDRMRAAVAMVQEKPPALVQGDAARWVEQALAEPQVPGTTRVLMHSIVWQYLGEERQAAIAAAMEAAGAQAREDCPLAWIALEANRTLLSHELVVRRWPGDGEPVLLARAHAHGAWIEWLSG